MLVKHPKGGAKQWLKKGIIGVIAFETVLFSASYLAWYKVNTDRAARKYLKDNYPFLLDTYYKAGEYFDSDLKRIREVDEAYWNAQKVALMEPSRVLKSLFWLTSLTGLGFALYFVTSDSQDTVKKDYPGVDKQPHSKSQKLLNILEASTNSNKPLYRLSKEELEKTVRGQ